MPDSRCGAPRCASIPSPPPLRHAPFKRDRFSHISFSPSPIFSVACPRDLMRQVDVDLGSIGERMAIRTAVHGGNMDAAISRLNDLNPEILETNSSLLFSLHQQRLIEFIRAGALQQVRCLACGRVALRTHARGHARRRAAPCPFQEVTSTRLISAC